MPVGRPTKYNDDIVKKAQEYLDGFYGKAYKEKVESADVDEVIPSIEGLAHHLGISRRIIYNWKEDVDKEEFLHTLDKIEERQKQLLLNQGLLGKFNAQITKLALGNHGMSDKVDQSLANKEGETFKTEQTFNFIPVSSKHGD